MRRAIRMAVAAAVVVAVPAGAAATLSVHGSITTGDPDQRGRLTADDPATTCSAPTGAALESAETTNYDVYSFRNITDSAQCVKVELAIDPLLCPVANPLQSAAYSPVFDPVEITAHYLGDIGTKPEPSRSYSFNVPAATAFHVTVNETNPGAGCNGYTLTVSGDGITAVPTAVGVISFTATRVDRGVRLRWRTTAAPGALGVNLYRAQGRARIRLNARLLATSAGTWVDRKPSSSYWLRQVNANGARIWHGPVPVGK